MKTRRIRADAQRQLDKLVAKAKAAKVRVRALLLDGTASCPVLTVRGK